jgi:DNA-binding Lrp family transcriptional regulator
MLDDLDRALLLALLQEPQAGLREHARSLGVARGTVQARYTRLRQREVVTEPTVQVAPDALGYPVLAFIHLHLTQGRLDSVAEHLATVPEVIEAHTTTGEGDVLCRVVARDNEHLEQTIQTLIDTPGVVRTRTEVALKQRIPARTLPLVQNTLENRATRPRRSSAKH